LAIAIFLGYDEIYTIGMDNTYPRDIYCNSDNKLFRLERRAGVDDFLLDIASVNPSMDVQLQNIFNLFYDLRRCFSNKNVINLDPFSLTDIFPKISDIADLEQNLIKK
jgi:hypothetical protein